MTLHCLGYPFVQVIKEQQLKRRFSSSTRRPDLRTINLAFELLCNALPSGAIVLDPRGRVIFANREATSVLAQWRSEPPATKEISIPQEILTACGQLQNGSGPTTARPLFGGRRYVRHPLLPHLGAVVALERSARDRRVAAFCVFLHDRLKDSLIGGRRDQLTMLTPAERRVAKLVAEGRRNSEIARFLGKSVTTVKSQLAAVFGKLHVSSRTQLVALLTSA